MVAAALIGLTALAFPSAAGTAARAICVSRDSCRTTSAICASPNSCRTAALPTPVTIETSSGRFQIERDGRVRKLAPRVLPFPRDAAFRVDGTWFAIRHRHLVVGRWRRTIWRSHGEYRSTFSVGAVVIAHRTIAFSYRSGGAENLYVAPLGGAERLVARNEFPLGWTNGGFYVYRHRSRQLLLRSHTGALEATVVRNPDTYAYNGADESLYLIAHGKLIRARGATSQTIAPIAQLGFRTRKPGVGVLPLGSLVELLSNGRLALVRTAGSLFAATRLPDPHGAISSEVAVASDLSAVAFTATPPVPASQTANEPENVYVLRAGGHAAFALHTERVDLGGCERAASVEWNARWLLYSTSSGNLAVVDSTARRSAIELTPIVARLGGARSGFTAYWSGHPPPV